MKLDCSKPFKKPASISVPKNSLRINNLRWAKCELLCWIDGKVRTFVVDNRAKRELLCEAKCELLCAKERTFVQGVSFCASRSKCLRPMAFCPVVHMKVRTFVLAGTVDGRSVPGERIAGGLT